MSRPFTRHPAPRLTRRGRRIAQHTAAALTVTAGVTTATYLVATDRSFLATVPCGILLASVVAFLIANSEGVTRWTGYHQAPLDAFAENVWMRYLVRWFSTVDRMDDTTRAVWAAARTRLQVGECMARWLTGDLPAAPMYHVPVDVDEDIAPGMTGILAACNRAGFVTYQSEGGYAGPAADGTHVQQCAGVWGFLTRADFNTLALLVRQANEPYQPDPVIGISQGPTVDVADSWTGFGICHPDAVGELAACLQVYICDVEPGRNDRLWPLLAEFARRLEARNRCTR